MVKIGRQKNRPNTLVSPAPVRWRTLAEKVYYVDLFHLSLFMSPQFISTYVGTYWVNEFIVTFK